jgi:hypothetical protein
MAALVAAMTFLAQRNLKFGEIALKRELSAPSDSEDRKRTRRI